VTAKFRIQKNPVFFGLGLTKGCPKQNLPTFSQRSKKIIRKYCGNLKRNTVQFLLLIFNFFVKFPNLRKFHAHFGIIFCHQIFDCFNSGYIIKSKLEIIGGALYLQQKKSTSHSSTDYCHSGRFSYKRVDKIFFCSDFLFLGSK
jgi:hypothetical protein